MEKQLRDEIYDILTKYEVQVTFAKKGGEHRIMMATLIPERLPETNGGPSQSNDDRLSVFNVDLQEWRSFLYDRLESIVWYVPYGFPMRGFKMCTKFYENGKEKIWKYEDASEVS